MASSHQKQGVTAQLPTTTITERLMTIQEVAEYLRVSAVTVRRWAKAGLLESYRPGGRYGKRLFSEKQVRCFLVNARNGQETRRPKPSEAA